ncbi:hypothetical protein BDN70DRAFT_886872 [Pholiota conissans]|uniref:Uncharacterized protein n=1 Tax=Pholiota conissans TaxID=109636 RepID=A0A9P5YRY0_9AGAR|nr:hypothetical protein BDN70DRAFT_886872 [Pholiota conissans]
MTYLLELELGQSMSHRTLGKQARNHHSGPHDNFLVDEEDRGRCWKEERPLRALSASLHIAYAPRLGITNTVLFTQRGNLKNEEHRHHSTQARQYPS